MNPPFVDGDRLAGLLSMGQAIDALEEAFAGELPDSPQRQVLARDGAQLLLMPAWGPHHAGVKLVSVQPTNPEQGLPLINGVYVLFDAATMTPVALFDAAPLTALRTAAVSGLATKHLAAPNTHRLVVFGTGVQARAHIAAMAEVRPLAEVVVVPRTQGGAAELLATLELPGREGTAHDVEGADIVCTCTTSRTPVFDGARLPEACHVNGVGSHSPDARELDTATIRRATVVVETKEAALAEAGDLLLPLEEGLEREDVIAATLAEVLAWGPPDNHQISVFKSVGVAFEDLAVAAAAFSNS